MRRVVDAAMVVLAALLAYLLLWPVPIEPVAWQSQKFRGYAGPHAHQQVGVVAVRQYADAWTIIDRTGARELTPPDNATVFGVMSSRANEERAALLVIENDERMVSFVTESMVHRLFRADERIVFACAATHAPRIAWLGE